jgi:hypothetical protein
MEGTQCQLTKVYEYINTSQVKIFYSTQNRMYTGFEEYSRYLWFSGFKTCYIRFVKLKF